MVVVDHASTMGNMCINLAKDFYGCLAHLLNLICRLFFDCVRSVSVETGISDNEQEKESDENLCPVENLLNDNIFEKNPYELDTIVEETEQELIKETSGFSSVDFCEIVKN